MYIRTYQPLVILLLSGILMFGICFTESYSQTVSEKPLSIPKSEESISWNTIFEADVWDTIDPLPMVQYAPSYGDPMSQDTDIRLVHDKKYLYVYGKMYDSDPEGVRINSLYRDRESGDDLFAVVLDAFNDNETAMWFVVNPAGVRIDMEVSNNAEGRGSINFDWNTFWDAKGRETGYGWEAAMRIPFSSLGFQRGDEKVTMGLISYRLISRENERHIFPDIPPDWRRGFAKPSQARKVTLSDIGDQNPVYITPYGLTGFNQFSELSDDGNTYERKVDYTYEPGVDVRYPLSSNLTLDFTLNTDFAQVEADDQQLDLERFDIFLPEKRQFFQERANIFDFSTGGPNRLFYSRRIGLHENEPIRILGGSRLTGRIGSWDIGILDMQTARRSDIGVPSENFGVARLRRTVFNQNSYAGGMITSRMGEDGSYNIGVGLDGQIRVIGDEYFIYNYAQTFDDALDVNAQNPFDNSLLRLQWSRQRSEGFNYTLTYKRTGERYEPEMGFEQRDFYTLLYTRFDYGYFTDSDNSLRKINYRVRSSINWRNEDGSVESVSVEQPLAFEYDNGARISFSGLYWYEDLRSPLNFTESVAVPQGSYNFYGGAVEYRMAKSSLLRSNIRAGYNSFYDGSRFSLSAQPTWNVSRYLELGGELEASYLNFPERNQEMEAYVARFRSLFSLNQHLSVQTLIQYDNINRNFLSNLRFRYNFREGNDLWIVYNENLNTDIHHVSPALPRLDSRTVMIKYTYTFGS